eukprot:6221010-Pyramimonas_sp.AAC.1
MIAAGCHSDQPGDLVDNHRPATTKDGRGGRKGPCPIALICPGRGQAVVQVGRRGVLVQHPDLRRTLCVE